MIINRDIIIKRFEYMDRLLEELEKIKNLPKEKFLEDFSKILSAQRALVLSINICIDIGAHILSLNKNGKPETYGEIFNELCNLKIIEKELEKNLIDLVGLRNLLGHIYMQIDNEKIYQIIQKDLTVLYTFKKAIISKFKNQLKIENKI